MHFLWVPSVAVCLRRIRKRVRKGGHHVPPGDVRRRYPASIRNFFSLYLPLACGTFPRIRHGPWRRGIVSSVRFIFTKSMSASRKPQSPTDLSHLSRGDMAMRKAQRLAIQEDLRYGLTPVLVNSKPKKVGRQKSGD
jgi:hypothetical protein